MSTAIVGMPSRKKVLYLAVALALLLTYGLSTSQAAGFGFVFVSGSGSINENFSRSSARLKVSRLLIDMPHNSKSFKICFTGSATPGVDFYVKARHRHGEVALTGGCFTDSWGSGDWLDGAERLYTIHPKSDNVTDPNETITATVSAVNWPAGYSLFGSYASTSFTIHGK